VRKIQRLGSDKQFNSEYINDLIHWKKKYPKSISEVWLATDYGFPPIEKHAENAKKLGEAAKALRGAGIEISLQLSNSIGHGQYISGHDCSGLVYEGSPVRRMVGHDGVSAEYCFCWNGAELRSYVCRELSLYAKEIQPAYVWIDDDFRADNHSPVRFGCFCSECIARFNAENGTRYTREELAEEMLHGSVAVRKAYIDFIREGLGSFMSEMCDAILAVSPNTAFGLQNGYHNCTGGDWICAFEKMKKASAAAPAFRPGAGAYDDHDPNGLFEKAYDLSLQNSFLPEYVTERIPEIENLPYTSMGKTPAGTALEAALHLANGHTGLSYAMLMDYEEEQSFYDRFFRLFHSMGDYFDRLAGVSEISRGGGLRYMLPRQDYLKKLSPDEDFRALNGLSYGGARMLLRDAIPLTFDRGSEDTLLLHGDTVRSLSDSEIETMLAGRVIMDGTSVMHLKERGFDLGLDARAIDADDALRIYEKYTDDELNRGCLKKFTASPFVPGGRATHYSFNNRPENAKVLGEYRMNPEPENGSYSFGDSTVILPTTQGGIAAVFGYALYTGIVSSTQRDRILRVADEIGYRPLPARVLSADQAFLYPRVEKNGHRTLAVSVANGTVGEEELTLAIRNPAGERFVWMSQYGNKTELSAKIKDGEFILSLPPLPAYSVGTVFCE